MRLIPYFDCYHRSTDLWRVDIHLYLFVVLGIVPRTSPTPGKCFTIELQPQHEHAVSFPLDTHPRVSLLARVVGSNLNSLKESSLYFHNCFSNLHPPPNTAIGFPFILHPCQKCTFHLFVFEAKITAHTSGRPPSCSNPGVTGAWPSSSRYLDDHSNRYGLRSRFLFAFFWWLVVVSHLCPFCWKPS